MTGKQKQLNPNSNRAARAEKRAATSTKDLMNFSEEEHTKLRGSQFLLPALFALPQPPRNKKLTLKTLWKWKPLQLFLIFLLSRLIFPQTNFLLQLLLLLRPFPRPPKITFPQFPNL